MTRRQSLFLTVNVLGGMAVLGSYAWGIGTHSGNAQALWGGIEDRMRIVYTENMLPAEALERGAALAVPDRVERRFPGRIQSLDAPDLRGY